MPKRVIDFDAMWGSDKLASCAEWAQAEYAWLYGLADASGCFELTNLRVIWGRVAAIRRSLSLERLEQIFHEFQDKGLLFVWEENGKRYGHWTGSDVPGRLPAPSWRVRLERLAPPVPKQQLAEFMSRFSRGRAASPGGGFFADSLPESPQASPRRPAASELSFRSQGKEVEPAPLQERLKDGLEAAQAQDLKWNLKQEKEEFAARVRGEGFAVGVHPEGKRCTSQDPAMRTETPRPQPYLPNLNSKSEIPRPEAAYTPVSPLMLNHPARATAAGVANASFRNYSHEKSVVLSRELVVGQGPECGPVRVKPEVLERIRARDASRSP
jgi:hypothetical protein